MARPSTFNRGRASKKRAKAKQRARKKDPIFVEGKRPRPMYVDYKDLEIIGLGGSGGTRITTGNYGTLIYVANHTLILRHLMNAVRTRERGILVSYCRDLAVRRFEQGYEAREVCNALRELNRIAFKHLRRDPESEGLREDIKDHVTMTLTWGCDEAQQVFEHLEVRCRNSHLRPLCRERSEAVARRAAYVAADQEESRV